MRGVDRKRQRRVVIKFARGDMIKKEVKIYEQLGRGAGIPLIFGQCIPGPSQHGFICMEEFAQDLSQFVSAQGPVSLGFACGVAGGIVSQNAPEKMELAHPHLPAGRSVVQVSFQGNNPPRY